MAARLQRGARGCAGARSASSSSSDCRAARGVGRARPSGRAGRRGRALARARGAHADARVRDCRHRGHRFVPRVGRSGAASCGRDGEVATARVVGQGHDDGSGWPLLSWRSALEDVAHGVRGVGVVREGLGDGRLELGRAVARRAAAAARGDRRAEVVAALGAARTSSSLALGHGARAGDRCRGAGAPRASCSTSAWMWARVLDLLAPRSKLRACSATTVVAVEDADRARASASDRACGGRACAGTE